MTININDIKNEYKNEHKNKDFETMPVGTYDCFVYDLEGGLSQNGNPKIDITLKVAEGDYKNRNIWTNITLTPKAWWKVEEFFEAIKYNIEELPEKAETPAEIVDYIFDDAIGSAVTAVVTHRKWEGETKENVKKLKPCDKDLEQDDEVPF